MFEVTCTDVQWKKMLAFYIWQMDCDKIPWQFDSSVFKLVLYDSMCIAVTVKLVLFAARTVFARMCLRAAYARLHAHACHSIV